MKTNFKNLCIALVALIAVAVTHVDVVGAKQRTNAKTATSKVSGMLGRVLHEHKKVSFTVMGQTKTYTGFPPREVVKSGTSRFDDLNLFVDVPDYPWMCTIPKSKSSRSSLHFKRSKPNLEVFLDVDQARGKAGSSVLQRSCERLKRDHKCKISAGSSDVEVLGIPGHLYQASLGSDRNNKQFFVWTATHNGRDYQLVVAGKTTNPQAIEDTMSEFLTRIRLIKPVKLVRRSANHTRSQPSNAVQKPIRSTKRRSNRVRWASDQ